jgi:hypothetical protein
MGTLGATARPHIPRLGTAAGRQKMPHNGFVALPAPHGLSVVALTPPRCRKNIDCRKRWSWWFAGRMSSRLTAISD